MLKLDSVIAEKLSSSVTNCGPLTLCMIAVENDAKFLEMCCKDPPS